MTLKIVIRIKRVLALILVFVLHACSSSNGRSINWTQDLQQGIVVNKLFEDGGVGRRLAFVSDEVMGSIHAISLSQNGIVDADHTDDIEFSPLLIGGHPGAMAADERGDRVHIYVADRYQNTITTIELNNEGNATQSMALNYSFVDWGSTTVTGNSKPVFVNANQISNPYLLDIVVGEEGPQHEAMRLIHNGSEYKVWASEQGQLGDILTVNQSHSLSQGNVSFRILDGIDPSDDGDTFYLGVSRTKPLQLDCSPIALGFTDHKLTVVCDNPAKVLVYNVDTKILEEEIAWTLDSNAILGVPTVNGDYACIPDRMGSVVSQINLVTGQIESIDVGEVQDVCVVSSDGQIWVHHPGAYALSAYDSTGSRIKNILMDSIPTALKQESETRLLVGTQSGTVYGIMLDSGVLVDTRPNGNGEKKSSSGGFEFYDQGATSSPSLVAVDTVDGATRSERWQLVYEGALGTLSGEEASVSGNQITFATNSAINPFIQVGDRIRISQSSATVAERIDEDTILVSTDTLPQGTQTLVAYSPEGTYLLIGSLSGLQSARCSDSIVCSSDRGDISLVTRPSIQEPIDAGDYFTFVTLAAETPLNPVYGKNVGTLLPYTLEDNVPRLLLAYRDGSGFSIARTDSWQVERSFK